MPKFDQDHGQGEETNPDVSVTQKTSNTIKSRFRGLKKLIAPISIVASVISGLSFLYKFFVATGDLSYPVIALGAVTISGLLLVPNPSTRLFALRVSAFVIDLAFLSVVTVALIFPYRRIYGEPSEFILMGVAWFWFLYFVFYDWYLHGTLGKRLLGLKISSQQRPFGVLSSFLRTFLTIVVPIIATWLGSAFAASESPTRYVAGMSLRYAVVVLVPISILVFGGNQGLVDKVLGTAVKFERRSNPQRTPVDKKSWALLCSLTLLCGLGLGGVDYVAAGRSSFLDALPKPNGRLMINMRVVEDAETTTELWAQLSNGLRNPAETVRSITILEASQNLFNTENTQTVVPNEIRQSLQKANGHIRVLRVVLTSSASPAVYPLIMRNTSELLGSDLPPNEQRISVLQFGQLDDYGLFIITQDRNTVVCVTRTKDSTGITFTDLNPPENGVSVSLDFARWLLLGDGNARENFKKTGMF
jgi:uncharacterized RDD family membrane protein YckC